MSSEAKRQPHKSHEVQPTTNGKCVQAVQKVRQLRSPCVDAHYEAYILQSRWTVGNLYASNLNLGQNHVKTVHDIDNQQRNWLSSKAKEQQKMLRRMEELQALRTSSRLREGQRGPSVSRHVSLETLGKHPPTQYVLPSCTNISSISPSRAPSQTFPAVVQSLDKQWLLRARKLSTVSRSCGSFPPFNPPIDTRVSRENSKTLRKNFSTMSQPELKRFSRANNGGGSTVNSIGFQTNGTSWTSRRTSLSATARLTRQANDKGSRVMPRWVPMAFRLQNVRGGI